MSRQIGSRFLFASIAFAGLTTSPAFSQPPQAQDLAIEQTLMLGLANQLEQCLDRELERVSRLCNADETELKTLRQNLKPEVDKYLELRRVQGKTPSDFVVRYLPKQLSDAIGAELRKLGNSGVDAFETDIATRREFRRETTIELLIHAMDAHVCITQDQEKQLRELFARDWNEDWIHLTENQMFDWGGRVFPVIPSGEIKNVLTSQQFVTWQAVGKLPSWHETIGFGGPPPKKEKWDATIEELRQRTRDAIRLRIVALKHDFDLSDLQVKRLQVAAKGCLEQVIGIHHTAYDQYANKIAKVQVGEGLDVDYEMLLTIVMPPAQLMDAKTDWPKFVLGTMDNKQKQHFQLPSQGSKSKAA